MTPPAATIRLDKWLWYARFFKSRARATRFCQAGNVRRENRTPAKPHSPLKVGDVLTFTLGTRTHVLEILALGTRRGPAPEAQTLYRDHGGEEPSHTTPRPEAPIPARRLPGSGRPTKAERRAIDRLKNYD